MDISVVLCTCNRQGLLRNALNSLLQQETVDRFTFEIIVVDDGSTDGTEDVVREILKKTIPVSVRYFKKRGRGIAEARNKGGQIARGKWLAFFDDDQLADPRWLSELYKVALERGAECVGGAMLLDLPDSAYPRLSSFCRRLLDEKIIGQETLEYPQNNVPSTGHVLIRRELFDKLGGFDVSIREAGEDSDFFWRARKQGSKMWYVPNAMAHHVISKSRLRDEHFKYRSLRVGLCGARIRWKYRHPFRAFLALSWYVILNLTRDVPILLTALIGQNRPAKLDGKCRMWCTLGYAIGILSIFAPNCSGVKWFLRRLEFRKHSGAKSFDEKPGKGMSNE